MRLTNGKPRNRIKKVTIRFMRNLNFYRDRFVLKKAYRSLPFFTNHHRNRSYFYRDCPHSYRDRNEPNKFRRILLIIINTVTVTNVKNERFTLPKIFHFPNFS